MTPSSDGNHNWDPKEVKAGFGISWKFNSLPFSPLPAWFSLRHPLRISESDLDCLAAWLEP